MPITILASRSWTDTAPLSGGQTIQTGDPYLEVVRGSIPIDHQAVLYGRTLGFDTVVTLFANTQPGP